MQSINWLMNLVWEQMHPTNRRVRNGIREVLIRNGDTLVWVPVADLSFIELLQLLPAAVRVRIVNAIMEARNEHTRSSPPGQDPSGRPRARRPRPRR